MDRCYISNRKQDILWIRFWIFYQQINPLFQSDETVYERFKVTSNAHREFIPIIQNSHSDFLQGLTEYGFVFYSLFIFPVCFLILRQFY